MSQNSLFFKNLHIAVSAIFCYQQQRNSFATSSKKQASIVSRVVENKRTKVRGMDTNRTNFFR